MRKPDNKPSRRKILKDYETRMFDNRKPYSMQENLDKIGYRKPEEYREEVSQYAW